MRALLSLIRPHLCRAAWTVLTGLLTLGAGLGLIGTGAYLLSRAALHPPTVLLLFVPITGVRLFSLLRASMRYLDRLLSHDMALRLTSHLKTRVFEVLARRLPPALFATGNGEWLRRLGADVDRLQGLYLDLVAPPFVLVAGVALLGGVLAALGGIRLAAPGVVGMGVAALGVPLTGALLAGRHRSRVVERERVLARSFVAALESLADLLMTPGAASRRRVLFDASDEAATLRLRLDRVDAVTKALTLLLAGLTSLAVLAGAAPLVREGLLPGVDVAAAVLMTMAAFEAVEPLAHSSSAIGEYTESGRRLLDDDAPPASPPASDLPPTFDLEISRLAFRYHPQGAWVLKGLSLSLPEGRHVAVVGPSGAGKSTLALILAGLLPNFEGTCRLGGQDIRKVGEDHRTSLLTLVDQRPHLFDTTLGENVRLGRRDARDSEVRRALSIAGLGPLLDALPDALDTPLGEGGAYLSGGERQRLALARAVLHDPRILILDEPLTGLDEATAHRVNADLAVWSAGRTVLYITHRKIPAWPMDEVWHLDGGHLERIRLHDRRLLEGRSIAEC